MKNQESKFLMVVGIITVVLLSVLLTIPVYLIGLDVIFNMNMNSSAAMQILIIATVYLSIGIAVGICGIVNSTEPQRVNVTVTLGIIWLVLTVIWMVAEVDIYTSYIAVYDQPSGYAIALTFIFTLILPALYETAAIMFKRKQSVPTHQNVD